MTRVIARACANIALLKYWGKFSRSGNLPATPSISLCLDKLSTTTTVSSIPGNEDLFHINGKKISGESLDRLRDFLDLWRRKRLVSGAFRVDSVNRFPTASGLASSSSGYAALCLALAAHSRKRLKFNELVTLARIGSGSAARSIVGGMAAMTAGKGSRVLGLASAADIPWGMVIALVNARPKTISSREGMKLSAISSSYYRNWLLCGRRQFKEMLAAIRIFDLTKTGEIMEGNTLAMHACMLTTAPPLIYWEPATINLIKACREWRRGNLETYFTIDAGPHVAFLARLSDLESVKARAKKIEGVTGVISCKAGGPAEVISCS